MPWIPDSRYWIQDSLSVEIGFWIPILSKIPDSTSKDFTEIPESAYPYKGRKDIRKEVATKSLLKPLFLHSMPTHNNVSMDLNNKEKIDMTSSR